jgi:ketosteroid isomerase-like protein
MIGSGATIEQKGKLFRVLKKQKDGSWKVARVIAHNDP